MSHVNKPENHGKRWSLYEQKKVEAFADTLKNQDDMIRREQEIQTLADGFKRTLGSVCKRIEDYKGWFPKL